MIPRRLSLVVLIARDKRHIYAYREEAGQLRLAERLRHTAPDATIHILDANQAHEHLDAAGLHPNDTTDRIVTVHTTTIPPADALRAAEHAHLATTPHEDH